MKGSGYRSKVFHYSYETGPQEARKYRNELQYLECELGSPVLSHHLIAGCPKLLTIFTEVLSLKFPCLQNGKDAILSLSLSLPPC